MHSTRVCVMENSTMRDIISEVKVKSFLRNFINHLPHVIIPNMMVKTKIGSYNKLGIFVGFV